MKRSFHKFCIALSLLLPLPLLADGTHEVYLNSANIGFSAGDTKWSLSPGYNYTIFPWLQAGANITYARTSWITTSVTNLTILVGPTFNVGGPIEDSYFFTTAFALKKVSASNQNSPIEVPQVTSSEDGTSSSNDPNGAGVAILFGKRFMIAGKLTYRPSVGIVYTGPMHFTINAISVSYHF